MVPGGGAELARAVPIKSFTVSILFASNKRNLLHLRPLNPYRLRFIVILLLHYS
jgi:hypothetical protein